YYGCRIVVAHFGSHQRMRAIVSFSKGSSFFDCPDRNRAPATSDQSAHPVGKICDLRRRPSAAESVDESCRERVARSNRVHCFYCIPIRLNVFVADEQHATLRPTSHADSLPTKGTGIASAELLE